MEVKRDDADVFLNNLVNTCGINRGSDQSLYFYISATHGAGSSECFLRDATGTVRMLDPDHSMFDFCHEDWRRRSGIFGQQWTWGWARVGSDGSELHMYDDALSDAELMGIDHALAWRRKMFGDVKIINPD